MQKVKPVYVDTTGKEIRSPFLSVPFVENSARDLQNNVANNGTCTIDIDALMDGTVDLFITGWSCHLMDTTDFGRYINAGAMIAIFQTVAPNDFYYWKTFNFEKESTVYDSTPRYWWAFSERFSPAIKIARGTPAASANLTNRTQTNIDQMVLYIQYFTLPYAT